MPSARQLMADMECELNALTGGAYLPQFYHQLPYDHDLKDGNMPVADKAMPRYRSHKEVCALKIIRCGAERGSAGSAHQSGGEFNWYMFEDKSERNIKRSDPIIARYSPTVGDYLVIYADGYESFSPCGAFEEGYTRISA